MCLCVQYALCIIAVIPLQQHCTVHDKVGKNSHSISSIHALSVQPRVQVSLAIKFFACTSSSRSQYLRDTRYAYCVSFCFATMKMMCCTDGVLTTSQSMEGGSLSFHVEAGRCTRWIYWSSLHKHDGHRLGQLDQLARHM